MNFEEMLSGGHPNSLGRTEEVVREVIKNEDRFTQLLDCYRSSDEVVRLRVSSAVKRVTIEHPEWTARHMDRLQSEVAALDQASAQWTLALVFDMTWDLLTPTQRTRALTIMRSNLANHDDWIVLNNCLKVLARRDVDLGQLRPTLERLSENPRKSVASNAARAMKALA